MARKLRILSIDGGGVRGLIPALVLAEIERRTGRHSRDLFDLIAGTSTGGLIALGLSVPDAEGRPRHNAERLVKLYEEEGPNIFPRPFMPRIKDFYTYAGVKYAPANLEAVLDKYFGRVRLSQALGDVMVTAYEIERRKPWFFKSWRARRGDDDFALAQVARATTAAPTYFPPAKVATAGAAGYFAFVDGGVFANTPAMCAFVEGRVLHPGAKDTVLVSLGTGEQTCPLLYDEVKNWGKFKWARPILDVVFDGASDTVDYQLRHLLPPINGQPRYYRFQTLLQHCGEEMDDASPANIRLLRLKAEEMIEKEAENLDLLCEQLVD